MLASIVESLGDGFLSGDSAKSKSPAASSDDIRICRRTSAAASGDRAVASEHKTSCARRAFHFEDAVEYVSATSLAPGTRMDRACTRVANANGTGSARSTPVDTDT
jgi:hypothetical protein